MPSSKNPKASPAWVTAGAVFLAVLLACGTGFPQGASTGDSRGTPLLRQGTIHEEDLSTGEPQPAPPVRGTEAKTAREPARPAESAAGAAPLSPAGVAPVAPAGAAPVVTVPAASPGPEAGRAAFKEPGGSYELPPIGAVAGASLPQRRASMKLVQQGRTLLKAGKFKAALGRFEQAVSVDAANPYSHYFIAWAHYRLGNYRDSLNFLDVAELRLAADARWLAEVYVLQARNAAATGSHGQADRSYIRALGLAPRHAFALAQLTTIDIVEDARRKDAGQNR